MTYIYHITHLRNLESILESDRIWCDNEIQTRSIETQGIAYEAIKERRSRRPVPTCKQGHLSDYVPFYFAPRSPMLYAIYSGMIESYREGQDSVLHLVSKIGTVAENKLSFTFTNGHAEMMPTEFYESLDDLDKIDWDLMKSKFWFDTLEDINRKWRRQAEFLVHNHFPVEFIAGIGVISEETKSEVETILKVSGKKITVAVLPQWYY
jgi:hypothetical protein